MDAKQVKSLLMQYGKNKVLAAVLEEKAKHLRSVLYGPTSSSWAESRKGGPARGMDDKLAQIEQIEQEAARRKSQVKLVELALSILDEEERRVAELCFLYPKNGNVKKLCEELHKERTAVFRMSNRVLHKLAGVLWAAELETFSPEEGKTLTDQGGDAKGLLT